MSGGVEAHRLAPLRPGSSNAMRRVGAHQSQLPTQQVDQSQLSPETPQSQLGQECFALSRSSPTSELIPSRPRSQPSSYSRSRGNVRRKLLCNWGGTLGQQSLISVKTGLEPIRAPYNLTVSYDLRSVLRSLVGVDGVYLAVLDAEKLRRKGTGIGLDALQASENWIARDCICTQSGKLRPLTAWKCPGKINVTLRPFSAAEREACVLLRVIAVRFPHDPHDWHALGAAVVLQVDTVGKLQQPESFTVPQQQQILASPCATGASEHVPEEVGSECCGIRLQQLLDFRDEINEDVCRYCDSHAICLEEGDYKFFNVCLHDPCPYRPMNAPKFDDHRGMPFVQYHRLKENSKLVPLVPNTSFIMRRYIIPPSHAESYQALLIKPRQPLKVGAYITHTGADSFMDFVDTLERALDPDDAIFVSTFARARGASASAHKGDLESFGEHPCAKALQQAERLVVIVDKMLSFTQCLWCNYEIKWAREWRTASFVWPHKDVALVELQDALDKLDLTHLVSSNPEDEYNFRIAIDGNNLDLQAVSQQLREFLQDRLVSYAAALQHVTDFQEISTEKVRRLHVEHERRTAIKEFEAEHVQKISQRDQRINQLERELAAMYPVRRAEQQAHKLEIDLLQEKMRESDAKHEMTNVQLETDMRQQVGDMQKEVHQVQDMLLEARAKIAQAKEREEDLQHQVVLMQSNLEDANNRAEAAELRSQTQKQRADREHSAAMDAQKCCDAKDAEKEKSQQAQNKSQQTIKLLEEKIARLEAEAETHMAHTGSEILTGLLSHSPSTVVANRVHVGLIPDQETASTTTGTRGLTPSQYHDETFFQGQSDAPLDLAAWPAMVQPQRQPTLKELSNAQGTESRASSAMSNVFGSGAAVASGALSSGAAVGASLMSSFFGKSGKCAES